MIVLKHVFRRFGMAPTFTAIALVTLALGIGANTAIFSVINGVLIKPLPYPQAQDLVEVRHLAPGIPSIGGTLNCSPTMYFTYREENQTFQDFGLWSIGGGTITGVGDPEALRAIMVTDGVLEALGVQPAVGRWFTRADDTPGAPDTVMLMYGYWQRAFGGDKSVVGRALNIDSKPRTVIGIMPQDFRFLNNEAELILPQQFDRNKVFLGNFSYQGIARLKPGVTVQQANADVGRMLGIWLKAWPTPPGFDRALFENARLAPDLKPLKQASGRRYRNGAVGADGNHRAGAVDRLRERRESVAGARRRTPAGTGDPGCARRRLGKNRARNAGRKPDPGRHGRRAGLGVGVRCRSNPGRQGTRDTAASDRNRNRSHCARFLR